MLIGKSFSEKFPLVGSWCKGYFKRMVKLNRLLGLNCWMTCFCNLGTAKSGNKRNNQENFLGFSKYLAHNQKYLLQFKLKSLSFKHYLMLGTIYT